MTKKVTIDQGECIGCEACAELCPEVFSFDDDEEAPYWGPKPDTSFDPAVALADEALREIQLESYQEF